jgi:hypothetical protein
MIQVLRLVGPICADSANYAESSAADKAHSSTILIATETDKIYVLIAELRQSNLKRKAF